MKGKDFFRPKDNFKDFYQSFDDYINFKEARSQNKNPRRNKNRVVKGKNIVVNIVLDFVEAIQGTRKEVVYHKNIK